LAHIIDAIRPVAIITIFGVPKPLDDNPMVVANFCNDSSILDGIAPMNEITDLVDGLGIKGFAYHQGTRTSERMATGRVSPL
jgi:hypothetical protein